MFRVILIQILLLSSFLVYAETALHVITKKNATNVIEDSIYEPTVIKLHNYLIYVTYSRDDSGIILKVDSELMQGTCGIKMPLSKDLTILSPKAEILGNGRIVIVYVEINWETIEDDTEVGAKLVHVDVLRNCDSLYYSIRFGKEILQSYKQFTIIPYQNTYDIILKSHLHCKTPGSTCIVRFSDGGNYLGTALFDFDTDEYNFDLEEIHPITRFRESDGYIYVSKHTSTIKILSYDYQTVHKKVFYSYIADLSVLNGDVTVCFNIEDMNPRTECSKFDRYLNVRSTAALVNPYFSTSTGVYNLLDGSALIVFTSTSGNVIHYVKRLRRDGKLSKMETYRYDCKSPTTQIDYQFVDFPDNACFSFECEFGMMTHCITLSKTELSSY